MLVEISAAIRAQVKQYGMSPLTINHGYCSNFARDLKRQFPTASVKHIPVNGPFPSHAVLQYKGRYYDSEIPEGVTKITDVPQVRRNGLKKRLFGR